MVNISIVQDGNITKEASQRLFSMIGIHCVGPKNI